MNKAAFPLPSRPRQDRFVARQRDYFRGADCAKFRWQTTGPFFAATERALVAPAGGGGRLLEVGSGEGGNLFHLGPRHDLTVGVDLSLSKAALATTSIPWARFVCADALRLPFPDGLFDRVLCRDVLHHLETDRRRDAVAELYRVCRPDGEVVVIEPNPRNPLMAALALLIPAERGLLHSTPARVAGEVRGVGSRVTVDMAQPLPVARALLHYRFGAPALGGWRPVVRLLNTLDGALRRVLPRPFWAYVVVRGLVRAPCQKDVPASEGHRLHPADSIRRGQGEGSSVRGA